MNRYDLELAKAAEATLEEIRDGKPVSREIFTRLKGLPVMLRVNGVPATLAFYGAKATDSEIGAAYRKVGQALRGQLAVELDWSTEPDQFFTALSNTQPADLARGFARLEAFAGWLRRLAVALEQEQKRRQRSAENAGDTPLAGNESPEAPTGVASDG
ncbi:MAG TPA: type III-B CRISPR module-associated protein Cmr5 [Micromonosporaceae bacterium]